MQNRFQQRTIILQLLALCVSQLVILGGCKNNQDPVSNEKNGSRDRPVVAVVNDPLRYFTERIAGNLVEILYLVPGDSDPRHWKPTAAEIEQYQKADLILLNGANFAKWLQTVSLPQGKTINTSESFEDAYIELEESFVHQHGPQGFRSQHELACVTWLDIQQAIQQAKAIESALLDIAPQHKKKFQTNLTSLIDDLTSLDNSLLEVAKQLEKKPLLVSAPWYQYFARRYQLETIPINLQRTEKPDPKIQEELRSIMKSKSVSLIVWDTSPSDDVRNLLREEFQLGSIVLRTGSQRQKESADWLQTMKDNLKTLQSIAK